MESALDKANRISAEDTREKMESLRTMVSGGGSSTGSTGDATSTEESQKQSSNGAQDGASSSSTTEAKDAPAAPAGAEADSSSGGHLLDKAVDLVKETVLGQSKEDDGPVVDHARDEQIGDFLRAQYKSTSGKS